MQPPRGGPHQRVPLEKNNQRAASRQPSRVVPNESWLQVRRRLHRGHFTLLVAVLFVFGVFMLANNARVNALSAELEEAKDRVTAAYNGVREKERQLQFSATEEFIDQQARQRFGYIREDEIRFVVDETISAVQPVVVQQMAPESTAEPASGASPEVTPPINIVQSGG